MRSQTRPIPLAAILVLAIGSFAGCGSETSDSPAIDPAPVDPIPDPEDEGCSVDCTALEAPPCMRAACNDGTLPGEKGECVMVPLPDGASCDDGDRCTVGDACSDGVCTSGEPMDCSGSASACTVGVCDSSEGACRASPVADDTVCDDGDACTVGDACRAGACVGGTPVDCSELDTACTVGACDPSGGECTALAVPDGTTCDDGDACSSGDVCSAGVCVGGAPKDCSEHDSACTVGVCDPTSGSCEVSALEAGTSCDDGSACTVRDFCLDGVCRGVKVDCTALDDVCMVGTCDPGDGTCAQVPRSDGTSCEVGDRCTVGGTCVDGGCSGGTPVDCSALSSACTVGQCDPRSGACIAAPANEGASCDAGIECTVASVCTGGVCTGGTDPACSMTPDGCCPSSCTSANDVDCSSCPGEEIAGQCVYVPSTVSVSSKATALSECTALGAGWGLCSPAVLCMTETQSYLGGAGCSCSGGASTCACSGSVNIYLHVDGPSNLSYYARGPNVSDCGTSDACTVATSAQCGTPLCCKPL